MQKNAEISIIEAAKRLRVEPSYAYLLVRSGRLKARKEGRCWLISEQSVRERHERLERQKGNDNASGGK
jgi:excisionase family DNA binding protein